MRYCRQGHSCWATNSVDCPGRDPHTSPGDAELIGQRADGDIQRNFLKEAAPSGENLGLAIVERIQDEPDARRPVVRQIIMIIDADQALLLEPDAGLDGDRPNVQESWK
jgi:hypothetical protein